MPCCHRPHTRTRRSFVTDIRHVPIIGTWPGGTVPQTTPGRKLKRRVTSLRNYYDASHHRKFQVWNPRPQETRICCCRVTDIFTPMSLYDLFPTSEKRLNWSNKYISAYILIVCFNKENPCFFVFLVICHTHARLCVPLAPICGRDTRWPRATAGEHRDKDICTYLTTECERHLPMPIFPKWTLKQQRYQICHDLFLCWGWYLLAPA